jgi:hypothetical protein
MQRFAFALVASIAACSAVAEAADLGAGACRAAYVVPYVDQCDFDHASIEKDDSRSNVAAAYMACDRAQTEAGNCLDSKVKQLHVVALSALYRAVSEQADIAMFAGQYKTAEALLREKLSVLDIAAKEGKPADPTIAAERASTQTDLATSLAGQCTERAYMAGAPAHAFAHDHRYKDLEKILAGQYAQYSACANLATSPRKRAYVQYVALVALEESGRAAQAAGDQSDANKLFTACLAGTARSLQAASSYTKHYLTVLTRLCAGRMKGTYGVDQPRPLDREGQSFKPLALPAS